MKKDLIFQIEVTLLPHGSGKWWDTVLWSERQCFCLCLPLRSTLKQVSLIRHTTEQLGFPVDLYLVAGSSFALCWLCWLANEQVHVSTYPVGVKIMFHVGILSRANCVLSSNISTWRAVHAPPSCSVGNYTTQQQHAPIPHVGNTFIYMTGCFCHGFLS